jgi:hypothetical protein
MARTVEELQRLLCERTEVEFTPPAPGSIVWVALQTMDRLPIRGVRHLPTETASGWYIFAGDEWSDDPNFYQPLGVEGLAQYCQPVLQLLALPPGWWFHTGGPRDRAQVRFDPKLLREEAVCQGRPRRGLYLTEAEWLTCDDPYALDFTHSDTRLTARKHKCLGVAYCRLLGPLLAKDELLRRGLELVEAKLDLEVVNDLGSEVLWQELRGAAQERGPCTPWFKTMAAHVLLNWGSPSLMVGFLEVGFEEWEASAELLARAARVMREIVGNPFRPVSFNPEWRSSNVVSLAKTIYESRDFSSMPILSDALQDAGCDSADFLNHCRDADGIHVRGCWVVDLVLGRG